MKSRIKSSSKYKNKSIIVDGIKFASKLEAEYYQFLLSLHSIDTIILQPTFELLPKIYLGVNHPKNQHAIKYVADFRVGDEVIDVKGSPMMITADAKMKHKMFKYHNQHLQLVIVYKKAKQWVEIR